jgi:hypothetical protein
MHDGQWLAGSLHAHGDKTGGKVPTQKLVDDYAARGYRFLMIAEHDVYTTEEDFAKLDAHGMVLIPGTELTHGPHILHALPVWRPERSLIGKQTDIAAALDEARAANELTVAAHPSWGEGADHISAASMVGWPGLTGLEIYNGLMRKTKGSPWAVGKWDEALTQGRRLWGFADDDAFNPDDVQLGWNVAFAHEATPAGVLNALIAGRFYASTGCRIESIQVAGDVIRIDAPGCVAITAVGEHGRTLATAAGAQIVFDAGQASSRYVRFDCIDADGRHAWTQPFFK